MTATPAAWPGCVCPSDHTPPVDERALAGRVAHLPHGDAHAAPGTPVPQDEPAAGVFSVTILTM